MEERFEINGMFRTSGVFKPLPLEVSDGEFAFGESGCAQPDNLESLELAAPLSAPQRLQSWDRSSFPTRARDS